MKKYIALILSVCWFQQINAQLINNGPATSSVAQTSVSDTHNWWATHNPAMLGYAQQSELGAGIDNRSLISELSTKNIQAALINEIVNGGVSFSYFGYSQYHEMQIGLSFAKNFGNVFALGMQFNYLDTYFIGSNEYRGAFYPIIGVSAHLSPKLSIGFSANNPFQTDIKTDYVVKRIASTFSIGSEYLFSPELVWRTQIDKEVSSNYRFATGFEYLMLKELTIKTGVYGSDYLIPCVGLGLKIKPVVLDINFEVHPILGINSIATLKYRFKSK